MGMPGCSKPWLYVDVAELHRQTFRSEWNELQKAKLTAVEIDSLRCLLFAKITENRANGISDRTCDSSDLWDIDRKLGQMQKHAT
jgi:hypothetical protein